MIPLGDVVPRRTKPVVTVVAAGLLLLSTLLFSLILGPEQRWSVLWALGASPATVPWPALVAAPWLEPSLMLGLANVSALILFGPAVEDRLGAQRMAGLMAAGAAVHVLLGAALARPPALPASGACAPVGAVLGTYLSLFPGSKLVFWVPASAGTSLHEVPALWGVALWSVVAVGRFVQLEAGWPLLTVTALGLLTFLTGRRLAPPARLTVSWWDHDRSP